MRERGKDVNSMCDVKKRLSVGGGSIDGTDAPVDLQQQQHQLHQTTQSLLMASSMLVGSGSLNNVNVGGKSNQNNSTENDLMDTHGHYSSSNIFGSNDSMNSQFSNLNCGSTTANHHSSYGQQIMAMPNMNAMHINVHELIMELHELREQLKEVTADRDRLVCEVSNLRLELDMVELKRLPEET